MVECRFASHSFFFFFFADTLRLGYKHCHHRCPSLNWACWALSMRRNLSHEVNRIVCMCVCVYIYPNVSFTKSR